MASESLLTDSAAYAGDGSPGTPSPHNRLLHFDRQRNGDVAAGCPLRTSREHRPEPGAPYGFRTMAQPNREHTGIAVIDRPCHRLVPSRSRDRLFFIRRVPRMVVPSRGQDMVAAFRLPFEVCVQIVVRFGEGGHTARDRVFRVLNIDCEIVRRRMVAI